MRAAGFSPADMLALGYRGVNLKEAGYDALVVTAAGFSPRGLYAEVSQVQPL